MEHDVCFFFFLVNEREKELEKKSKGITTLPRQHKSFIH